MGESVPASETLKLLAFYIDEAHALQPQDQLSDSIPSPSRLVGNALRTFFRQSLQENQARPDTGTFLRALPSVKEEESLCSEVVQAPGAIRRRPSGRRIDSLSPAQLQALGEAMMTPMHAPEVLHEIKPEVFHEIKPEVLHEIKPILLRICDVMRAQQETLFQLHVATVAMLSTLKDGNRIFATRYASSYMAAEEDVMSRSHLRVMRSIADAVRMLKDLEG